MPVTLSGNMRLTNYFWSDWNNNENADNNDNDKEVKLFQNHWLFYRTE